jgi:hypothetical protein
VLAIVLTDSQYGAPSRPGLALIRRVDLERSDNCRRAAAAGYLSHSEAAAAPVDGFTDRQTLVVSHCPQSLPCALLSVPDESIAFTERG